MPPTPPPIQDLLKPGTVLYLLSDFTDYPKEKFLVLASVVPELLFFVINSAINDFAQTHPDVLECYVGLRQAEHSFLRQDSWVHCGEAIRGITAEEIEQQIKQKIGSARGVISGTAKADIRQNVSSNRLLEARFKRWILDSL